MTPPTNIDGTDITGATMDGTDVTEITVDGDTVFTAETLPVAYSDLVAWYPFDPSFYGGFAADDATALFNPAQSGDLTAYDGTVNGATFQSGGGVTDIGAGANSGAFDFDGSNDSITAPLPLSGSVDVSVCLWHKKFDSSKGIFQMGKPIGDQESAFGLIEGGLGYTVAGFGSGFDFRTNLNVPKNTFVHVAATYDASSDTVSFYLDGDLKSSGTQGFTISAGGTTEFAREIDGDDFSNIIIDDARIYDKELSASEVSDIYNNTDL